MQWEFIIWHATRSTFYHLLKLFGLFKSVELFKAITALYFILLYFSFLWELISIIFFLFSSEFVVYGAAVICELWASFMMISLLCTIKDIKDNFSISGSFFFVIVSFFLSLTVCLVCLHVSEFYLRLFVFLLQFPKHSHAFSPGNAILVVI